MNRVKSLGWEYYLTRSVALLWLACIGCTHPRTQVDAYSSVAHSITLGFPKYRILLADVSDSVLSGPWTLTDLKDVLSKASLLDHYGNRKIQSIYFARITNGSAIEIHVSITMPSSQHSFMRTVAGHWTFTGSANPSMHQVMLASEPSPFLREVAARARKFDGRIIDLSTARLTGHITTNDLFRLLELSTIIQPEINVHSISVYPTRPGNRLLKTAVVTTSTAQLIYRKGFWGFWSLIEVNPDLVSTVE